MECFRASHEALVQLGFAAGAPVPPTSMLANVVGGVVFGVGMASAGYCPGTIVAEAGEGRLDAWIAGLSGLVVGAMVFGLLQPLIMRTLSRVDYMLSARAVENPLSWGYLTRVHTGHFEPIGFTVMWLLAHLAPLNWSVTVLVLIAGVGKKGDVTEGSR